MPSTCLLLHKTNDDSKALQRLFFHQSTLGQALSRQNSVHRKAYVAFSPKKQILAEYPERVGVEPGEPGYEWAKNYFTKWRLVKDTWDIYIGNNLKNRFQVPWRPRAVHRWKRMRMIPVLAVFMYGISYLSDKVRHVVLFLRFYRWKKFMKPPIQQHQRGWIGYKFLTMQSISADGFMMVIT